MPGCGKSTIGKKLAKLLNFNFVDLDEVIESKTGKTISFFFEHYGEKNFRNIERDVLHETLNTLNVVIACGGGTAAWFDNMDFMNKNGVTIYLNASIKLLAKRLSAKKNNRPLLSFVEKQGLEDHLMKIFEKREPFYLQARIEQKLPLKNLETLAIKAVEAISKNK